MAQLLKFFEAAMKHKASDVHIAPGEPVMFRRFGTLIKVKSPVIDADATKTLIFELLSPDQQKKLIADLQLDFVITIKGLGRFRGSAMLHHTGLSAVFRNIPFEIPSFAELGLPPIIEKVLDNHQGMILVTGGTGHGKSTTLAAMVDYINSRRAHHILTVEDPIEFVHPLKKGVVNQRQLNDSTLSYDNALRGALRQDPDVIMIGELRDLDTISLAISAAETGHLVLGTLATSSAPKTIDRIIDSYPSAEQNQIRAMLSESLKAVITQRLVVKQDGSGRALALEILLGSLPVTNLIRDNKVFQIPSLMQMGKTSGMRIMDDSLVDLFKNNIIAAKEVLANANDRKRVTLQIGQKEQSPQSTPQSPAE
jgi:twitching motility protein PilT